MNLSSNLPIFLLIMNGDSKVLDRFLRVKNLLAEPYSFL